MIINWQWIVVGLLLAGAVYYVFKTVKKSFTIDHDCPDCGVSMPKKKQKGDKLINS